MRPPELARIIVCHERRPVLECAERPVLEPAGLLEVADRLGMCRKARTPQRPRDRPAQPTEEAGQNKKMQPHRQIGKGIGQRQHEEDADDATRRPHDRIEPLDRKRDPAQQDMPPHRTGQPRAIVDRLLLAICCHVTSVLAGGLQAFR